MNTTQKTRQQLDALAAHFDSVRECILQQWRITTESAPEMTIASSLTRLQFNDHIPGVLDSFVHTLRTWPKEDSAQAQQQEKDQVTEHGLQRWQQGYQLRELTREWGHLQMCLMEELETYAAAHRDLQPEVMPTARRALANLCWDGISDSTTQYWRLHQAEAAGHVRDLEQALDALNQLEQTRAEAWREAAHDLRGSVAVVTGSTSLLQSEDMAEPVRSQVFEMLQRSVQTLHEMLNDLMSLARLGAGHEQLQVAPFDAATLLTDFCATSLPLAEARGLYLKMEGPASLPVEGDRAKIQRILQNLLLNALKYTRRGGVTVMWGNKESGDKGWMFCVQDTGPGLDSGPGAPLARQLYEATQVAHEVQSGDGEGADHVSNAPTMPAQSQTLPAHQLPGEGVGLSIVKRLCELLDASLELETSPGEGSTFRVTLPRRYASSGIA
jgi:signal transduction histidine kinase